MSLEIHRLGAQAMATEFQIQLCGPAESRARVIAGEVLRDLETLENELSRFRPGSDIWQINHAHEGETLPINPSTYDCIALAQDVHTATDGAFDISIGPLFAVWTTPDHTRREPSAEELRRARAATGMDKVTLSAEPLRAHAHGEERWLDLGGIGKGYALDQMAILLRERGVDNALLDAGGSTLLAMGDGPEGHGWPVGTGDSQRGPILLRDRALSGSGFSERGEHVMDPRLGKPVAASTDNRWSLAPGAALADALSTAFLVMSAEEIEKLCAEQQEIEGIF